MKTTRSWFPTPSAANAFANRLERWSSSCQVVACPSKIIAVASGVCVPHFRMISAVQAGVVIAVCRLTRKDRDDASTSVDANHRAVRNPTGCVGCADDARNAQLSADDDRVAERRTDIDNHPACRNK